MVTDLQHCRVLAAVCMVLLLMQMLHYWTTDRMGIFLFVPDALRWQYYKNSYAVVM